MIDTRDILSNKGERQKESLSFSQKEISVETCLTRKSRISVSFNCIRGKYWSAAAVHFCQIEWISPFWIFRLNRQKLGQSVAAAYRSLLYCFKSQCVSFRFEKIKCSEHINSIWQLCMILTLDLRQIFLHNMGWSEEQFLLFRLKGKYIQYVLDDIEKMMSRTPLLKKNWTTLETKLNAGHFNHLNKQLK